ncbi:DUF6011 domain-containing protein [Streptomyces iconiensis]|uniref:DUF6011 domain-containing protein n=1 Tax=Streptomyces iconiensis TaxID=1384038 RepID=A0ABT6ZRV6_9ACTN|nr:DUF6011 domain-containing protein [Streptomyces iconiensis]MDJ1131785.1 DUF6011 domain-containing protein [Streptomyces iconiensis]
MTGTETAKCLRCGRTLTSADSVARGYGRTCAAKIRRANVVDLADFQAHQVASAHELIEDGAIVAIRSRVFRAVSTDGSESYLCHPANCACPAGRKAVRPCYHQLAARLLLAA